MPATKKSMGLKKVKPKPLGLKANIPGAIYKGAKTAYSYMGKLQSQKKTIEVEVSTLISEIIYKLKSLDGPEGSAIARNNLQDLIEQSYGGLEKANGNSNFLKFKETLDNHPSWYMKLDVCFEKSVSSKHSNLNRYFSRSKLDIDKVRHLINILEELNRLLSSWNAAEGRELKKNEKSFLRCVAEHFVDPESKDLNRLIGINELREYALSLPNVTAEEIDSIDLRYSQTWPSKEKVFKELIRSNGADLPPRSSPKLQEDFFANWVKTQFAQAESAWENTTRAGSSTKRRKPKRKSSKKKKSSKKTKRKKKSSKKTKRKKGKSKCKKKCCKRK